MCNAYRISPKKCSSDFARRVNEAAAGLPSPLVRKSDPCVAMLEDAKVEVMRWGFIRPFNRAINNARSDHLESAMWGDAFGARRCVIPVSLFYEWGPGAAGQKQAYQIDGGGDDFLWIAGLWEPSDEGHCATMITTGAGPAMAAIHERMPAILSVDAIERWLDVENSWNFQPWTGPLRVVPCESPLKRKPAAEPGPKWEQTDLF